jgi:neutral ceramidase
VEKPGAKISRRTLLRRTALAGGALCVPSLLLGCKTSRPEPPKIFRAGAHAIDITPKKFPVSVNGLMQDREATQAFDPLHARCLVLDDGRTRLAIAICDSLLISRELMDEAKALAHRATGIPVNGMLIAATHTHSAPTVTPIFQSEPDGDYSRFLVERIAAGIAQAHRNLAPARAGWAVTQDATQTFCRLWIVRKPGPNPFGQPTDRIVMHPGYQNPNGIEPAGPTDPTLTLLSVQSPDGRPIALLANYTMHHAQEEPCLSADYFGCFADKFTKLIGAEDARPAFVAMMSNGAQGDAHCFDYSRPRKARTRDSVAESLARAALAAYGKIAHHDWVPLAVRERTLNLGVRPAMEPDVAAARQILEQAKGRPLQGWPEIYARETVLLSQYPWEVQLKLQALRIGGLAIVALPVEAYAITGLEIKRRSPIKPACVIDLANGYNGYMAPPEHHLLGGYSTWRARSCYLSPDAAPKVIAAALGLLRAISNRDANPGRPRPGSVYARAVLASDPLAYWPLNELSGPRAHDLTENANHALYEPKVLFNLTGPPTFSTNDSRRTCPRSGKPIRPRFGFATGGGSMKKR